MRRLALVALLLTIGVAALRAQRELTADQRDADLIQLASMYAKIYAPYEWKRDVIGFDLYRLTPWLQRIHQAADLDVQEAFVEYLASLNDTHASISFPSPFLAQLGFTVDIYDGKVLIDSINRTLLPQAQFPFGVGDELVALNGEPVQQLIASFGKLTSAGNPRSRDRVAAARIAVRSQINLPHASSVGDTALTFIRLASTGALNNYVIPWTKTGVAIDSEGPVPSPRRGNGLIFRAPDPDSLGAMPATSSMPALLQMRNFRISDDTLPAYMDPIRPFLNSRVPDSTTGVLGYGARTPIYGRPAGFVTRLGTQSSHFFFSGTYLSNGVRIGLLRIPNEAPSSTSVALQQLDQEIAFFNSNTDVLIVDITRNTGGIIPTAESFAQRLIPNTFRTIGFEFRATALEVSAFAQRLTLALGSGAPPEIIANLRSNFEEMLSAYNEERGRTAPLPINSLGRFDLPPAPVAYTKPLLVLVDEFTTSSGDMLAAILQDNHRGPLLGMRTNGAGGNNIAYDCTTFTEAFCSITAGLVNRGVMISTPEFPPSPYIENIGVRPDIVVDYMTRENLMTGGAPFVQAFTTAAVKLAQAPH
jgi:peptidase S41-like protein/PDZ domain-containing protein